jgi:serine/threonine-protein kinase
MRRGVVTTERFRRLERAFGELVAVPASERTAALAALAAAEPDLAAELAVLLAADAEASPVIEATVAAGARLLAAGPEVGRQMGRYLLERELGRGGTSTVYLARAVDAGDAVPVALKLLERRGDGAELLRRFENERRILATLEHPGIARLLDVGLTADSRPYVVLEYVRGLPIDAHCDARGLDLPARIRLFREVCAIVHAAHQRLVVHRDLKPSNVLVDAAGAPKLLDFGIARLLDPESQEATERTSTLFVALTPAYASPEQLTRGPVTTATDVWSLGVLLAELLTGRRPFRTEGLPPAEVERIVQQEPPSFSSASRSRAASLPPDVETILRMALRKEPERRYGSVAQFAEDLGRFLDGHPVAARPDTWAYRTATFVRRHRWSVAAAGAFVALLVAFAAATAVQSARIARQRDRAERVSSLLVDLFEVADPNERRGSSVTAREILDRGAARLASELEEEPETRAALQETIGRVYQNLGLFHSAAPLLEESLATRRRLFPGDHPQVASSLNRLAVVRALGGEYTRAEPLFREALAMRERLLPADAREVVASTNNLALVLHDIGDYAGAERLYRRAIALDARRPPAARGTADVNLGLLLVDRGEPAAAVALLRPALERVREVHGEASPRYAVDLGYLGLALQALGRYDEAERLFRRSIAIDGRVQPGEHVALARDLHLLGALLYERGDLDAAEPLLARAQAIRERLLEPGHPELAATLERRARLVAERRDLARAAAFAERALAGFRRSLPPGHPSSADALVALAGIRVERGDCAGAALLAREAVAIRAGRLSPADWRTAEARGVLGTALVCAGPAGSAVPGEVAEGERLRAESLVKLSAALPPAHPALRWLREAPALTGSTPPETRRRSPTR